MKTAHRGRPIAEKLALCRDQHDGPPFAVVVGQGVRSGSTHDALFHWCANTDPGRDAIRAGRSVVFDATPKAGETQIGALPVRDWPPQMTVDDETTALIDRRWGEYGLG